MAAEVALHYCVLAATPRKGSRASRPLSAFPFTPFCQTAVHSRISVGLPARRPPPPLTSTRGVLMICDSPPHRAQEHVTALPASSATLSCRDTPLTAVPFHLQPRRVRSNGRSRRRAVRAVFHGLFSLPMKHLGSDPRSIFPSAKVGLTAHRKIYLTDFRTKFQ